VLNHSVQARDISELFLFFLLPKKSKISDFISPATKNFDMADPTNNEARQEQLIRLLSCHLVRHWKQVGSTGTKTKNESHLSAAAQPANPSFF
jgi:hypothetical protein